MTPLLAFLVGVNGTCNIHTIYLVSPTHSTKFHFESHRDLVVFAHLVRQPYVAS